MSDLFVIAEAGVNHNGRLDLALELVDVAAAAGADAVKFQTFKAASLATAAAPLASYQEKSGEEGAQFEMLKRLELDDAAFEMIATRCIERGIEFMSTPFDVASVHMLDALGMKRFKVPSGEANNPLLLRAVASTQKPLILSTGMCTLAEVERALTIIGRALVPGVEEPLWDSAARAVVQERVTVLQCTTEYPAPPSSANLRAMDTIARSFGVRVGYSDHTEGTVVAAAAVALGATVVEKHFTLDRTMPGPDHAASLEARDLASFVSSLHSVQAALGDGIKAPQAAERDNRRVARRSLVAACKIRRGESFSLANLALKRPATGIPADRFDEVVGKIASRDYAPDELIE